MMFIVPNCHVANAMTGNYLHNSTIPSILKENTCEIIQNNQAICTGTRTSNGEVYTAAHCGDILGSSPASYGVRCGSDQRVMEGTFDGHPRFRNVKNSALREAGMDIGKLLGNFSADQTNEQVQYIDFFNFQDRNADFSDCLAGGFGYDNNGVRGNLKFTRITRVWYGTQFEGLTSFEHLYVDSPKRPDLKSNNLVSIRTIRFEPYGVEPTDSGGPLFCKQDGVYKLVGTNSGPFLGALPLTGENRNFQGSVSREPPKQKLVYKDRSTDAVR